MVYWQGVFRRTIPGHFPRKTTQLSEPFQGTEGRFYWLSGLRRSCFVVNQTMAAKASYQKANKIRSYGLIFRAVGITHGFVHEIIAISTIKSPD